MSSGQTGGHSWDVFNLPTDGRTLFVRLRSLVNGVWFNPPQDYVYTAFPGNVMTPFIAPPSGTYKKKVKVSIGTGTPGATIHYTLDGSEPTTASPLYTSPFTITTKGITIVRAKAFHTGVPDSTVAAASYTIVRRK